MIFGWWTEGTPDRKCGNERFWEDDEIGIVFGGLMDKGNGFLSCVFGGEEDG